MVTSGCLIILIVLVITGCAGPGLLYTDVITPYSLDSKGTPVGSRQCTVAEYRLREPVTRFGVSALWSNKAVAEACKEAGISEIYYADRRTFSVLFGSYRKRTLIIYGD